MMALVREILFRGQTRKYGEKVMMGTGEKLPGRWVYGGIFPGTGDYSIIYGGNEESHLDKFVVHSDTVGQYTGMPDKNNTKIFEGDVVRVCLNSEICVGAVEFDERVGAFIVKFPENKCRSFLDLFVASNKAPGLIWIEVIGNIHDNPELFN